MDSISVTQVDPRALRVAAQRLDYAAELLQGALHGPLSGLQFDAVRAGQRHGAAGGAVRAAVDRLAADVASWQRCASEVAAALRTGAAVYTDSEELAVEAFG